MLAISIGRDDNEIFFSHPDYRRMFSLRVPRRLSVHLLLPYFSPTALFTRARITYARNKESKRTIRRERGIRGWHAHKKRGGAYCKTKIHIHVHVGRI